MGWMLGGVAMGIILGWIFSKYLIYDTQLKFYEKYKQGVLVNQAAMEKLLERVKQLDDTTLWLTYESLLKRKP